MNNKLELDIKNEEEEQEAHLIEVEIVENTLHEKAHSYHNVNRFPAFVEMTQ
jgi:hypothetical protein